MLDCDGCREEFLVLMWFIDNQMIAAAAAIGKESVGWKTEAEGRQAEMIRRLNLVQEWAADHGHADAASRIRTLRELVQTSDLTRPDMVRIIRDRRNELVVWANGR